MHLTLEIWCDIRLQSQSNPRNYVLIMNIQSSWSIMIQYITRFFPHHFFLLQFVQQRSQRKNWWSLGSLIAFSFDILSRVCLQLFDLELMLFIRCKGSCLFDCGVIKLPVPYQGVNNITICHYNFLPLRRRQQQILFAKCWGNLHPPSAQLAGDYTARVVTLPCWPLPPPFLDASHR